MKKKSKNLGKVGKRQYLSPKELRMRAVVGLRLLERQYPALKVDECITLIQSKNVSD